MIKKHVVKKGNYNPPPQSPNTPYSRRLLIALWLVMATYLASLKDF
jgi:hypothetical protein